MWGGWVKSTSFRRGGDQHCSIYIYIYIYIVESRQDFTTGQSVPFPKYKSTFLEEKGPFLEEKGTFLEQIYEKRDLYFEKGSYF